MLRKYFHLLFSIVIICYGDADVNVRDLSTTMKEDLFAMSKGLAVLQRTLITGPVSADEIKFFLYTKDNPNPITINYSNPSELNNQQVDIVFVIHGWIQDGNCTMNRALIHSLLAKNDQYYVVSVDWSKYALQEYYASASATKDVGAIIGKLIAKLIQENSIPPSNILLVGFSLGGHVVGFAGETFTELTSQTLPRIIALDPAGPSFQDRPKNERLNENNAKIVHVIHTSGGSLGYLGTIGTIDFFPNGGQWQNGCAKLNLTNPTELGDEVTCVHQRAWQYFCESLTDSHKFLSKRCGSYDDYQTDESACSDSENMGNLNTETTGNFYLETNSESPYSK